MRIRLPWKIVLFVASLAFVAGCADTHEPTLDGPTGEVQVAIAALEYPELTGATFEITIIDSLGANVFHDGAVSSDDYGTPDGRVLFVAPCSAGNGDNPGAGDPGSEVNTVRVRLIEVRTADQVFTSAKSDAYFPPAVSREVVCVENQDVRADFLLTFVRRAQQGFVDVVVAIQDVFCSAKVSCEQDLMADPEPPYAPGPTLVTGFACTDGQVIETGANYVGFEGVVCCNGALPGDESCTTLSIDPLTGGPIWSDPGEGVLDTQSYLGSEEILGKVFHNTTWRLDPESAAGGCVFYGRGFFNWSDGADPVAYEYFEGDEGVSPAPGFFFSALITPPTQDGEMTCDNHGVQIYFGPELPSGPPVVTPGPVAKTKGGKLLVRRVNCMSWDKEFLLGVGSFSHFGNYTEAHYPPGYHGWINGAPYQLELVYNPADGLAAAIQLTDADRTSLAWWNLDAPGCAPSQWDRMEIHVKGGHVWGTSATTKLLDVKLGALSTSAGHEASLGDFDAGTGELYAGVTGFDFPSGFVLTGTLVVDGWAQFCGIDAYVEVGVHCAPAP